MITKILFFIAYPLDQRDYKRFGIDILKENGFDVEIWDLTQILRPQVIKSVKISKSSNTEHCHSFLSWHDVKFEIQKLSLNCFIVNLIPYNYKSYFFYRILSNIQVPYSVLMSNAIPGIMKKANILNKFKNASLYDILNALFIRIPPHLMGIRPATVILAGGEKSIDRNYPTDEKTEILWIHTLDYDIFLNECHNNVKTDASMGIFLDQYLPFHPDYVCMGVPPTCTSDNYYPKLNEFFDFVEHKYGSHIVIAAHPRSNYEDHPDYFEGRPVVKGKTVELIKKSGFVIAHGSTSINFAVLFNKPIIFIRTNELDEDRSTPSVQSMPYYLGKKLINIDDSIQINLKKELLIDKNAYADYKNSYIKKIDSIDLPFWQVFADYINKRYNQNS